MRQPLKNMFIILSYSGSSFSVQWIELCRESVVSHIFGESNRKKPHNIPVVDLFNPSKNNFPRFTRERGALCFYDGGKRNLTDHEAVKKPTKSANRAAGSVYRVFRIPAAPK